MTQKGRQDSLVAQRVVNFLKTGSLNGKLILRTDNEPAITSLMQEVAARRSPAETILQQRPLGSPQSLGAGERFVQTISGCVRTLVLDVEAQHHQRIRTSDPIFGYAILHAAWLQNCCVVRTHGTTAYAKVMGRAFSGELLRFASPVLGRLPQVFTQPKLEPR